MNTSICYLVNIGISYSFLFNSTSIHYICLVN